MFGRRRRRLAASAALTVAPLPVLSDEQLFLLLHDKLGALVGEHGAWTLAPRRADDTEVIFHGLKAREIATELAATIIAEQSALRGETHGEPSALTFTPAPITSWNEHAESTNTTELVSAASALADTRRIDMPVAYTVSIGVAPTGEPAVESVVTTDDELAAASAAWIDKASATLASARLGA